MKLITSFNFFYMEIISHLISSVICLILITFLFYPIVVPNFQLVNLPNFVNSYNMTLSEVTQNDISFRFESSNVVKIILTIMNIVSIGYNSIIMLIWFISRYGLYNKIEYKRFSLLNNINEKDISLPYQFYISFYKAILAKNQINIYFFYVILGILVFLLNSYIFFGLQILCLINLSSTMKNFLIATGKRVKQVVGTFIFMLINIYIFAAIAFFLLSDNFLQVSLVEGSNYLENTCGSLLSCFLYFLDTMNRWESNKAEYFARHSWKDDHAYYIGRLIFRDLFFINVVIVLIPVFFFILIDNFNELRGIKDMKDNDVSNICFICGATREMKEKNS